MTDILLCKLAREAAVENAHIVRDLTLRIGLVSCSEMGYMTALSLILIAGELHSHLRLTGRHNATR